MPTEITEIKEQTDEVGSDTLIVVFETKDGKKIKLSRNADSRWEVGAVYTDEHDRIVGERLSMKPIDNPDVCNLVGKEQLVVKLLDISGEYYCKI